MTRPTLSAPTYDSSSDWTIDAVWTEGDPPRLHFRVVSPGWSAVVGVTEKAQEQMRQVMGIARGKDQR